MKFIKNSAFFGTGIFRIIQLSLLYIFLIYVFVTIISSAITHKNLGIVFKELGEELINPLKNAQEKSFELRNDQGLNVFNVIFGYWGFFFNLYVIFLWFKIFVAIAGRSPFSNTSEWFKNVLLAFFMFFFVAIIHSVIFLGENWNYPFIAFRDIFSNLTNLFNNVDFKEGVENIFTKDNTCIDDLCVV